MRHLLSQNLHANASTLDIQKLSMAEPAQFSSATINRDPHVDDIGQVDKHVVDFAVRHVARNVVDMDGAGGLHALWDELVDSGVPDHNWSTLECDFGGLFSGSLRAVDVVELNICDSGCG